MLISAIACIIGMQSQRDMASVRSIGIVTYTYVRIAMELEESGYVNHVAAMAN